MPIFGRTIIALTAASAITFGVVNAVAAKTNNQKPSPAEGTQSNPSAKSAAGKHDGSADKKSSAPQNKPEANAKEMPPDKWSNSEIAEAKAHCEAVLKRVHAVYAAHEPIRKGSCGAPAPVELISIGQNPEVTFSPPPVVRCDLVETLVNWLEKDLQPLAKKHFGAPIVRIETMSGYSCRSAFGRKTTKLSEHGLANAVDIGAFVTAAKTVSVLDDWRTTNRELAEIAERKALAEKQAAELAAAGKAEKANLAGEGGPAAKVAAKTATASVAPTGSSVGAPAAGQARSTNDNGVPKVTVTLPGASTAKIKTASRDGEPARLGGPAPGPNKVNAGKSRRKDVAAVRDQAASGPLSNDQAFLREAHVAACSLFGTTLGPEANRDHRNHLHIDMASRKFRKICD